MNTALGGGALPSGYSFTDLNDLAAELNASFDGGVASAWALVHLSP